MSQAISTIPEASSALAPARYDDTTKLISVRTNIADGFITFDPAARLLNEDQMLFLSPLGIDRSWPVANVLAFLVDCEARGFNAWTREAYLMKYPSKTGGSFVHHIAIAGMRRHAEETGLYGGRSQYLYCGEDGKMVKVWPHRDTVPYACEVTIRRRDWDEPLTVVALYDEFAPMSDEWIDDPSGKRENNKPVRVKTGRKVPTPMWQTPAKGGKPTVMLGKCAEALALRGSFPHKFNGWYVKEEMEAAAADGAAGGPSGDDTGQRRRDAYRTATQPAAQDVDGDEIGAEVLDDQAAEQATVAPPPPAGDPVDDELLTEKQVRGLLLDELAAQAAILSRTPEWMVVRWERAHDGLAFATAPIGEVAAHVRRFRDVVVEKLRDSGRHDTAVRYAAAPLVGPVADLFGCDPREAVEQAASVAA